MTRPNFASCFWKSACWIRRISDPPPAATTFSWTPPNAIEWMLKSSRRPWPKELAAKRDKMFFEGAWLPCSKLG
jgi:hypothetical protein